MLPLESVPNFSEGRDAATIEAIGAALSQGVRLLDVHSDPDHHRSVFTVVGKDGPLVEALVRAVEVARDLIDLRRHEGAHPRIGAADIVPVVPLRPTDMERAKAAAREARRAPRRARPAGVPLRRARSRPRAGVLPPGRDGGAGREARGGSDARFRALRPPSDRRRRHRRGAAPVDRVQRRAAWRDARPCAHDRVGDPGARRRLPGCAGRSGWSFPGPAGCR